MNTRIKELIEQATTTEDTYPAGCNGHPTPVSYFNKEKFAELIIRKCAGDADGNQGVSAMLKYFGIKE